MESRRLSLAWSGAPVDEHRIMVVSPRNGRSYVVGPDSPESGPFFRLAGLRPTDFRDRIEAPRARLACLRGRAGEHPVPSGARRWYRFLRRAGHRVPPAVVARLAVRLGRLRMLGGPACGDLEACLQAVEPQPELDACFARAALMLGLAVAADRPASMYIGVLAPSRKMHAWTVLDRATVLEHVNEHWMYCPVLEFRWS